ncbi:MAG TPA: nucleotidyltransferase family protein [Verrucomicrobiae bacterium]|nr:nucleotidyltransferase family protein [Verrucomicrobiae bacterium]
MPSATAAEIRSLAAGPLNWDLLLSNAAGHTVTPLLAKQLAAVAGDALSAARLKQLKDLARAAVVRSLAFTAELVTILDLFRSEGLQAIPYKGPVLAEQAYGNFALREFDDLDLILRQKDMPKANRLIASLGYRAKYPWTLSQDAAASLVPGEYCYRNERRRMVVELHTERTLRHFPLPPDIGRLAERLVRVSLSGHAIETFAPEDGLPLLCIHGSKDFWERISWVADVAEFVQANPRLDWDQVVRLAESLRAMRMLHLGLALAMRFFSLPLPGEIRHRVEEDKIAGVLAEKVELRVFHDGANSFNAARRFWFRRRMIEGSFEGWRYSARLTVSPAEEDWEMVRLPRPLAPLYVALRPLRLLVKYGASDTRPEHP